MSKAGFRSGLKLDLPDKAFQVRISMIRMHVLSALLTVIALAACAIAYRFVRGSIDSPSLWFIPYLVLLIVLHELSHALGWILRGVPIVRSNSVSCGTSSRRMPIAGSTCR